MNKIKKEINALIVKSTYKTCKENEILKQKVSELEKENLKLNSLLFGQNSTKTALKIISRTPSKSLPS